MVLYKIGEDSLVNRAQRFTSLLIALVKNLLGLTERFSRRLNLAWVRIYGQIQL